MASKAEGAKQGWPTLLLIGLGVAVLVSVLSVTPPYQTVEHTMRDQLFKIRGPMDLSDSPIIIVAISQDADEEIPGPTFPWSRELFARLVENLNEAGAKAIGIDVIFEEAYSNDPRGDTLLAKTLEKYENVVLAGKVFRQVQRHGGGSRSMKVNKVEPMPVLKSHSPNPFGVVTNTLDSDDVIRRYLLYESFLKKDYYALGLESLRIYKGFSREEVERTSDKLRWGSFEIPLATPKSMRINYYGGSGSFPYKSFEKVIDDSTFQTNFEREAFPVNTFNGPNGLLQQGIFKDKIVLVGATMPEQHDFHKTPFSGEGQAAMPGVEVHANALQTVLDSNYVYDLPVGWELGLILLIALSMVWITRKSKLWLSGGLLVFFLVGYLILGLWLFISYNYILAFTGPMSAFILGFGTTLGYDYVLEQREKMRIKGMFQSYVSPALVEEMVESQEEPKLGGEKKYMTALFSDIQSFSTISEQLDASRLVQLINDYLTSMTNILQDQGGTLDKYIGDAIVAFYGAPIYHEDHAYRACLTSQLMQRELNRLCEKWKKDEEEWPEIIYHMKNRIGINTGDMVTGNMGSHRRFNYTIMGDHVNLAARCESAAKSYGVYTMVTEYTKEEAEQYGDRCVFRFLDKIVVKGKTEPVDVYEIFGLEEGVSSEERECIEIFEEGFQHYLQQDWERALKRFEESKRIEKHQPEDGPAIKTNPSMVMIERCNNLREQPPGEDWNGVYVMTHK